MMCVKMILLIVGLVTRTVEMEVRTNDVSHSRDDGHEWDPSRLSGYG